MKHTRYYTLVSLLLAAAFGTGTGICYPNTYRAIEGNDFWALTADYWHRKLAMTPAITSWCNDFLYQFYSVPAVGAAIHSVVLLVMALLCGWLMRRLFSGSRLMLWLGLLPAVVLGYFSTFDLNIMLQVIMVMALLHAYISVPSSKVRLALSLLLLPPSYMLVCMPLLALMVACFMLLEWLRFGTREWRWQVLCWPVLWLIPIIYSQQVAFIPFENRYTHIGSYFDALTSDNNKFTERAETYIHLADQRRWKELLVDAHARRDAQRGDGMALRFALLAESELGTLSDNILDYPIQDENLFLYPHLREYVPMQLNRLFYLALGVNDEAFHQAEEYYLQQRNGICFKSLRQMVDYSIAEGEWEVADKLMQVLSGSTCHAGFVRERTAMLQQAKQQPRKEVPLRADNLVGGYPFVQEMLRLARYYDNPVQRKKMMDYVICSYLLHGDAQRFAIALRAYDIYRDKPLPRAYQRFVDELTANHE